MAMPAPYFPLYFIFPRTSFIVIGNAARLQDPTCWNSQWIAGPFQTYSTHTTANNFVNNIIGRPMEPKSDLDIWGISMNLDWNINENLIAKSITAYREVSGYWARDIDHSPLLILQTVNDFQQTQFTQEFQLLGSAAEGALNWIAGLYYFQEDGTHIDIVEIPGSVFDSGGSIDNTSKAAFGQATYDFTDKFSLAVGYTIPLGSDWSVTPRVDYSYTSKIANDAKNTALLIQPGLSLLNAVLIFEDDASDWKVRAGIRNLTNQTYLIAGDNSTPGVFEGVYARPREWYLSVKRNF